MGTLRAIPSIEKKNMNKGMKERLSPLFSEELVYLD
jgi:hypothetical protein